MINCVILLYAFKYKLRIPMQKDTFGWHFHTIGKNRHKKGRKTFESVVTVRIIETILGPVTHSATGWSICGTKK